LSKQREKKKKKKKSKRSVPSIQFSPSQAKLPATKKQPKDKEKEKGTNITSDRLWMSTKIGF
jgi:hypothetical protein